MWPDWVSNPGPLTYESGAYLIFWLLDKGDSPSNNDPKMYNQSHVNSTVRY